MTDQNSGTIIDASTFQKPLRMIAEVIAQKAKREAPVPQFMREDLHVLVRQAIWTYNFMFYLHADDRLETDANWKNVYTVVALPLVRNMIDCLFNITLMLQDPQANGARFRLSGFKRMQVAIDEDEQYYGGQAEFDVWIAKRRDALDMSVRSSGFTLSDVSAAKDWPLLGSYAKMLGPGAISTTHQQFLKTFLYGHWRQYSAMAHATFAGLADIALYYVEDSLRIEDRSKIDEDYPLIVGTHLSRAAAVLLCVVTELQAYFKFDDSGARINERIHWRVAGKRLIPKKLPERYEN
jgi:hypothetical protein